MSDRREFLQAGLALPAACAMINTLASFGAHAAPPSSLQLERFIYDVRFAESYDIAQTVAASGVELAAIADDLMTLWYDELDLRWKQAPMTLGGITMPEALFVLETFALDRRMRVVYRGEHSAVSNGRIAHELTGATPMLEGVSHAGENWINALAQWMTQYPADVREKSELGFQSPANEPALRDVPLVSWIIAPRTARAETL